MKKNTLKLGRYAGPRDLERIAAANLSRFDGGDASLYTGEGDDFLEFEGSVQNFAQEGHENVQFTIEMVNANAATRTAILFPGYHHLNTTLAAGQMVDGAFNDTGGNAGLTASSLGEKTIRELLEYLKYVPSRWVAVKINSTLASQIQSDFTITNLNPFKTAESRHIRPKTFQNQNVNQDKIITVPVNEQLDFETRVTYPFVGSSTTSLTFFFGARMNQAGALRKKARKGKASVAVIGAQNVIQASQQKYIG